MERLSNCCGAKAWGEIYYNNNDGLGNTGICSRCKEHAIFLTEKEESNYYRLAKLQEFENKMTKIHAEINEED